jgi:hypothetical protein
MGEPHVISALKARRARVAGEIIRARDLISGRTEELATLDAVLAMFSPDCDPEMIVPIRPFRGIINGPPSEDAQPAVRYTERCQTDSGANAMPMSETPLILAVEGTVQPGHRPQTTSPTRFLRIRCRTKGPLSLPLDLLISEDAVEGLAAELAKHLQARGCQ